MPGASHKATTLLLRCMDFRLEPDLSLYLKSEGLIGKVDIVSLAGAAKNLAEEANEANRELVFTHVRLAQELHGVEEVILMSHTDCGAYGGAKAFREREHEEQRLVQDMQAARDLLTKRFKKLRIRLVLARIEEKRGQWVVSFEKISSA